MVRKTVLAYLDRHYFVILFSLVIGVFVLWAAYEQTADGAYCSKTCQARLAAQAEEKKETKENNDEPCYGIYCDDKKEDTKKTKKKIGFKTKNFIAIRVSQGCEASGTCPNYKELAALYDNSNKWLSGDFYFNNETGEWEREEPRRRNVFEFYRYMDMPWVVFVDPDEYTWQRSKQIFIESQLHYIDRKDIIENQVRKEYVGLDVNGCKSATIGWMNNGSEILLDVLNYFYSNCKEPIEYDPTVEIFMKSKIFDDCNRECFWYKEQLKKEIKIERLIAEENWYNTYCKNDKDEDFDSYDRNKEECDRIKLEITGKTTDYDKPCYGIYCDDKKEKTDNNEKTAKEVRDARLSELEEIDECKEYQIWDEMKIKGEYRRLKYDCNDDKEREEYLELVRPKTEEQIEAEDAEVDQIEIKECEAFRSYELTLEERKTRAEIVTCEDDYERDEYLQEMKHRYPDGIPE